MEAFQQPQMSAYEHMVHWHDFVIRDMALKIDYLLSEVYTLKYKKETHDACTQTENETVESSVQTVNKTSSIETQTELMSRKRRDILRDQEDGEVIESLEKQVKYRKIEIRKDEVEAGADFIPLISPQSRSTPSPGIITKPTNPTPGRKVVVLNPEDMYNTIKPTICRQCWDYYNCTNPMCPFLHADQYKDVCWYTEFKCKQVNKKCNAALHPKKTCRNDYHVCTQSSCTFAHTYSQSLRD